MTYFFFFLYKAKKKTGIIPVRKSLLNFNPQLAKEWNYEKNGKLQPDMVTTNSHKKVWWKCEKGHEWQSVIAYRNRGYRCPICAREKRKGHL